MLSFDHQNHSKWHKWCHVRYRKLIGNGKRVVEYKRGYGKRFQLKYQRCRIEVLRAIIGDHGVRCVKKKDAWVWLETHSAMMCPAASTFAKRDAVHAA